MRDVKQLKLFGGEEILCDLVDVQWDDDEGESLVIKAAYSLVSEEDFENGLRYYTFRPFMMHIYDPSHILLLNSSSVICSTNPHPNVIEQYIKHIEKYQEEDETKDPLKENDQDERVVKFKPKLH